MEGCENHNDDELVPAEPEGGPSVWSDLLRRFRHLSALARVSAHARGAPALATFLMQGLVL